MFRLLFNEPKKKYSVVSLKTKIPSSCVLLAANDHKKHLCAIRDSLKRGLPYVSLAKKDANLSNQFRNYVSESIPTREVPASENVEIAGAPISASASTIEPIEFALTATSMKSNPCLFEPVEKNTELAVQIKHDTLTEEFEKENLKVHKAMNYPISDNDSMGTAGVSKSASVSFVGPLEPALATAAMELDPCVSLQLQKNAGLTIEMKPETLTAESCTEGSKAEKAMSNSVLQCDELELNKTASTTHSLEKSSHISVEDSSSISPNTLVSIIKTSTKKRDAECAARLPSEECDLRQLPNSTVFTNYQMDSVIPTCTDAIEFSSPISSDCLNSCVIVNVDGNIKKIDQTKDNQHASESQFLHESAVNTADTLNNFDAIYERELEKIDDSDLTNTRNDAIITDEDLLLEKAFIPLDSADIRKIHHDDQDMLKLRTQYEISDELERVLASELQCRTFEEVRNQNGTPLGYDLSPIASRLQDNNNLQHNLSSMAEDQFIEGILNENMGDAYNLSPIALRLRQKNAVLNDSLPDISQLDNSELLNSVETDNLNDESYNVNNDQSTRDNIDESQNPSDEDEIDNDRDNSLFGINPDLSLKSLSLKAQKGSCDNTNMTVQTSNIPRTKKMHACLYCHGKYTKIIRHIETVHKNEKDVKLLKNFAKGTKERQEVMDLLRSRGDFIHNTHPMYNDGELIVRRRPKLDAGKEATDYKTCPRCLVGLLASNARHHIAKCTKNVIKGERSYKVLGKLVEGRLHADASDTLRLIVFPVLKEDDIVRLIRYDWLIIVYGNKLCLKYTPHFQHNMIRARLRLIGRFLQAAKALNPEITDLASVYQPKWFLTTIDAIRVVARIDHLNYTCEAPAVAENLVTYVKQIGQLLESEYIIREDENKQKAVGNYLKLHAQSTPVEINKIAMETQARMKRQKIVVLPLSDDIQKLMSYLLSEQQRCFRQLSEKFSILEWLKGLKLIAVYILVFNRRRVGDIQNILTENVRNPERIDAKADKEMYNRLDSEGRRLAKKYYRILVRGKLNRDVPVLLTVNVLDSINLLLRFRSDAQVPESNKYLFGLPNYSNNRIRVVNLCLEMRRVSALCGAEKPDLLRGTTLRKHVATKCVELDLQENAITDIANHLGHSDKIHREVYRQPLKNKVIIQISKILEHVSGDPTDENEIDNENDDANTSLTEFVEFPDQFVAENSSTPNKLMTLALGEPSTSSNDQSMPIESSYSELPSEMKRVYRKQRWSIAEKSVVETAFATHIASRLNPSFNEIIALKDANDCLKNRTKEQIKTFVNNQFKKKNGGCSEDMRKSNKKKRPIVVSDEQVHIRFKKPKHQ